MWMWTDRPDCSRRLDRPDHLDCFGSTADQEPSHIPDFILRQIRTYEPNPWMINPRTIKDNDHGKRHFHHRLSQR